MKGLNLLDMVPDFIKGLFTPKRKPSPDDFRRGVRKTQNIVGMSIDHNSANRGLFMGGIVPMKRRFKGVSRTQGRKQ